MKFGSSLSCTGGMFTRGSNPDSLFNEQAAKLIKLYESRSLQLHGDNVPSASLDDGHCFLIRCRVVAPQWQIAPAHPSCKVLRLNVGSHFLMFEVPEAMATAIEQFVG